MAAYGVALQLENVMRTNGELLPGTFEEIVSNYQRTFTATATSSVSLSLSDGPTESTSLPSVPPPCDPPNPGLLGRTYEKRPAGKVMEAIKGNREPP